MNLWTDEFRRVQSARLKAALVQLPAIWNELPEDWTEVDCGLNLEVAGNLLWRFERDPNTFWKPQ